ncbi:MAG: O-antigen ligase family protein [Lachnospiraceae bacterium]|nr:O-antigen ligase family protein [Lachnospiraceae bacterium]
MSKKKKNPVLNPSEVILYIFQIFVSLYCVIFFIAMPLFYHNKYYDIGDFKYNLFMYLTVTFLSLSFIILLIYISVRFKEGKFSLDTVKNLPKNMSVLDWFVLAFGVASILSFLFSPNRTNEYPTFFLFKSAEETSVVNLPWEGYNGWNMGLRSQLMFVAIYFLVSRLFQKSWKKDLLYIILSSSFIVYLLGVLHRFHIDPLGLYEGLNEYYISKFLSTLGQSTWYSSFMIVILPIGMAFYIYNDAKGSVSNILLTIYITIGAATFVTQNSDSAYPAFAAIIAVMFASSFTSNERFLNFFEMLLVMLGAMKITGFFQFLFPQRLTELDSLSTFISGSPVTLILFIIMICIYVFLKKAVNNNKFDITRYTKLRNIIIILIIALIPTVIIIGYLNTKGLLPTNAFQNVEYLTFNDQWGNNRGFTWRTTIEAMKEPSYRKMMLTGPGPDCYATVLYASDLRSAQLYSFWNGEVIVCAHNEWLNMLFNEGIIGFISYFGIFATGFILFIRKCNNPVLLAGSASIIGYVLHNFFCYQQILCTPMIFFIIALCEMFRKTSLQKSKE